ncbi:hypothetical protein [Demequina zhanjiangensis]|uniref:Uncharacterized protein n=1 Tax=Demequina zhanjiangensis TaxID=3051659 RepID=A0ABT8G3Q1_9MICO|nr:hypothetical protein [Demequina sp. SYSU T00b26]MDN4473756.1 hypothetical protein [Demequina sp. SYSU T00b26]
MMLFISTGGVTPRLSASSYRGDLSGLWARARRGRLGVQGLNPGHIA